jgi:hypothetical protein
MGMQTDIKAASLSATGAVFGAPTRVKGLTISHASGGTIVLRDGGAGGEIVLSYTAPATAGEINILLPGEGILCRTDVHATIANATLVVYYG